MNNVDLSIVKEESSPSEEEDTKLQFKQVFAEELDKIYKSNLLRNIHGLEKTYKEETNINDDLGELKDLAE